MRGWQSGGMEGGQGWQDAGVAKWRDGGWPGLAGWRVAGFNLSGQSTSGISKAHLRRVGARVDVKAREGQPRCGACVVGLVDAENDANHDIRAARAARGAVLHLLAADKRRVVARSGEGASGGGYCE